MVLQDLLDPGEHRPALAERVKRAALDKRLQRFFVKRLRGDPLQEVGERYKAPPRFALGDDRVGDALAEILDRIETEADRIRPIATGLAISAERFEGLIDACRTLEQEEVASEALVLLTIPA